MWGSLIALFHLRLVTVIFSSPSWMEMKFYSNFFHSLCFYRDFLNHFPNRRHARLLCWIRTLSARGTNVGLRYNYGDEYSTCWKRTRWNRAFKLHPPTHPHTPFTYSHTDTQLATSDFQTEHISRWLNRNDEFIAIKSHSFFVERKECIFYVLCFKVKWYSCCCTMVICGWPGRITQPCSRTNVH